MGKHTTGGGRRVASARAVPAGGTRITGQVNVVGRVNNALRELGSSRQAMSADFDTNFRVGDNGIITVTGTPTGIDRMESVLSFAGAQQMGRAKRPSTAPFEKVVYETRWQIVE